MLRAGRKRKVKREVRLVATSLVPPPWVLALPPTVSVRAVGGGGAECAVCVG